MKVTILGCGASSGVPLISCDCKICNSNNPKNNRTRSSILVEDKNTSILIDTSPDLRAQALRENFTRLDAVFYTHDHADHTHGIDDLRSFNYINKKEIDVFSSKAHLDNLSSRFPHCFQQATNNWYKPVLKKNEIKDLEKFYLNKTEITPIFLEHGDTHSIGFKFNNFLYTTDFKEIPTEKASLFVDLDIWVVDCLQIQEHNTHPTYKQVMHWIEKFKPKKAILTHMSHVFDYDDLIKKLPSHIRPAYDGMKFVIS